MFTGLVEEVGIIKSIRPRGDGATLIVSAKKVLENVQLGDSIAISGACQTVTAFESNTFTVEAVRETMQRTKFSVWHPGEEVNLERALLPTSRMGGHMVQGHVDGVAKIAAINQLSGSWRVRINQLESGRPFVVEKGSITLDGISLTVASVNKEYFEVEVIPHTWGVTTLHNLRAGDNIHIEFDIIAKYVSHMLSAYSSQGGVNMESLLNSGFNI